MIDWTAFKFDPVFERAALKNADCTYCLAKQMLSYKQDDPASITDYLMNDIRNQLEAAQ